MSGHCRARLAAGWALDLALAVSTSAPPPWEPGCEEQPARHNPVKTLIPIRNFMQILSSLNLPPFCLPARKAFTLTDGQTLPPHQASPALLSQLFLGPLCGQS